MAFSHDIYACKTLLLTLYVPIVTGSILRSDNLDDLALKVNVSEGDTSLSALWIVKIKDFVC